MAEKVLKNQKGNKIKEKKHVSLESRNLDVWYGDKKVLDDVNIEIESKSITALIGPSGCGKSTFLRLFNRMNDFIEGFRKEGEVLIEGKEVYNNEINIEELRKQVGMVFQKPNPFPKTIYENVAFGLRIQGINKRSILDETVERSLKQAALWEEVKDDLKTSALSLSGGQQQRLCIARALAVEPSIILMDEPASALDPISTAKIEDLIFKLKKDYTILIVTHNMHQASRVSDKTGFFLLGKLIEYGETNQIFTKPVAKETERYISGRFG